MILIHSNVSNLMVLIRLNVNKFFKNQHTNMYFFLNRRSLDESGNSCGSDSQDDYVLMSAGTFCESFHYFK